MSTADADADAADPETRRRVWRGLANLVVEPGRNKATVAAELGLTYSRARALPRLLAGPMTLRQLAESMSTDAPWATLIVDDLSERGLVERQPHPQDRRSKLVVLTASGRVTAERVAEIMDTPPEPIAQLNAEELAFLDRLVGRFDAQRASPFTR